MKISKAIFGTRRGKVWFIVSASVLALLLTVTILATTVLYPLLISTFLGGPRRIVGEGGEKIFNADFANKVQARENGESVNEDICEEGFVLLKNNNNSALPVATSAGAKKKVSVFGKNSVNLVTGGSGSGAGSGEFSKTIFDSLAAANYEYNTVLKDFYNSNSESGNGRPSNPSLDAGITTQPTGETPQSRYTSAVKASYANYSDLALIVISRIGGESFDLPTTMGAGDPGARSTSDHYLQLDQYETDLINAVCAANFTKVVVLINSSTTIETGFLDDPSHYAYNSKIDAALWIGAPGDTGIMALGRILSGSINPSGRTPDTFMRDFKQDPTWKNFGDTKYTDIGDRNSTLTYAYVDYEEGIYVGYRYWETRGFTDGADWYNDHVVFPFGFGKSYTSFTQEITGTKPTKITKSEFTLSVKVSNTGSVAGKDAIQVYVTAPIPAGGVLEKPHVVLAGFAKTPVIQPGTSATVDVEIDPYYFASYDSVTSQCFVLDAGNYEVKLGKNAHEMYESFTAAVDAKLTYKQGDSVDVKNRFDDADDELTTKLSRYDWSGTMPASRSADEQKIKSAVNARINSTDTNNTFTTSSMPTTGAAVELMLKDLLDKPFDDPSWGKLVEQISIDDMAKLFNRGAFTTEAIMSIGKPKTIDADGPAGFVVFMGDPSVYGTSHYASEPVMAATMNTDLLYEFGKAVGNEALIGNEAGDGAPYSGWYAPGVNLHRSPFGGRAGEYFSEDPYLSGMLAAHEIQGVMSKGVYTQVKHFAVNEQETNRSGVCTWLTEQTLREVYLRPFEMAVKIGGTRGMMSSFNRIGSMWTGGDYRLLTEVLREEWGFRGMVICDFNTGAHMNARQMAYAGGDLNLQTVGQSWNPRKSNATDIAILQKCTKNILYTVAKSNAMNDDVVGYRLPIWVILLIVADAVIFAGLAVWGFFVLRGAIKNQSEEKPA